MNSKLVDSAVDTALATYVTVTAAVTVAHTWAWRTLRQARRQRGSVSIEHVLWAVAVIAIVGIVVLAITRYVRGKSKSIK